MFASRETPRPSQVNGLRARPIYPFCIGSQSYKILELVAIATIEATQQVDAKDDVNKALREYGKYI